MDSFNIQGGKKLRGIIPVMGAKNAAGPIIAATTLIRERVVLKNIPDISDVSALLDILESMGASVIRGADHSVVIDASSLDIATINFNLIKKIRFSIFFLGCLARRFGKIQMAIPGGCSIGSRPLDAHFSALRDLGYECSVDDQWITVEKKSDPRGSIVMSEFSVTATETAILASVLCDDSVTIKCAAADHVVQDLCWFLNAAGARISGIGTHSLSISGVKSLHAAEYWIMPDPIETGTFIALAAATRGSIEILNAAPEFLTLEMRKFENIGVTFTMKNVRRSLHDSY
ncbi:MAG: UDP-N-acetylglucosamine 1-carboxyvinyltransferase, partial [Patescibacteria group bacterium]